MSSVCLQQKGLTLDLCEVSKGNSHSLYCLGSHLASPGATDLNRVFSIEEIKMVRTYPTPKCSSSLAVREMKIKTILKLPLTLFGMANIKTTFLCFYKLLFLPF